MKHSPGPWSVFNNHNSHWQIQSESVGKGYYSTIGSFCQRDEHPVHGGSIKTETARANAAVAAVAPEMLELLQRMLNHGRRCNWFADRGDEELVSEAEALIERATTS